MTRIEIIRRAADRLKLDASLCDAVLTQVLVAIARGLAKEGEVDVGGFGKFELRDFSGEKVVTFLADNVLKGFLTEPSRSSGGVEVEDRDSEDAEANAIDEVQAMEVTESEEVDTGSELDVVRGETAQIPRSALERGKSSRRNNRTELSSLAQDFLGLDGEEMKTGLGLDKERSGAAKKGMVTFPVKITHQMKNETQRHFRPAHGEERRSFKLLTLKNFFLNIGSVVRDRETHEPMIVVDVKDQVDTNGERYCPVLLRVEDTLDTAALPASEQNSSVSDVAHHLKYEEIEFDIDQHEVLMVLDPAMGPRPHCFDVGDLKTNDRRDRARICLAQEYERFQSRKSE